MSTILPNILAHEEKGTTTPLRCCWVYISGSSEADHEPTDHHLPGALHERGHQHQWQGQAGQPPQSSASESRDHWLPQLPRQCHGEWQQPILCSLLHEAVPVQPAWLLHVPKRLPGPALDHLQQFRVQQLRPVHHQCCLCCFCCSADHSGWILWG